MENFHKNFHEPYYNDYIKDDINLRLETSGFEVVNACTHFMTRVWTARKNSLNFFHKLYLQYLKWLFKTNI